MDGAGRIPVLCPARHGGEVPAGARLVAERPHDHGRVVLVPLDRAAHTVYQRGFPLRVIAGVLSPAGAFKAVRFQVALKHNIKAELVRKRQELRMGRVVGRPDRVDIVLLHEPQFSLHHILGNYPAKARMVLVAVDAAQQDLPPLTLNWASSMVMLRKPTWSAKASAEVLTVAA